MSEAETFRSLAFVVGTAALAPIVLGPSLLALPVLAVALHRHEPVGSDA